MTSLNIRQELFSLLQATRELIKVKEKETSIALTTALILYAIILVIAAFIFAFYLFHR